LIGPHGTSAASSRSIQTAVAAGQPFGQERAQDRPVRHPIRVRGEARIGRERRSAERAAQSHPLPLGADRDGDLAVGRGERSVRDDARMGVPRRPGGVPVANAFWAWLTRIARVDSRIEASIR
jgi:hypothetical protein